MADFVEKLKGDLIHQFRDQKNIAALMDALGEQLGDIERFYSQLRTQRALNTAVGRQLDGAGDIVALTREEAGGYAVFKNPGDALTDEMYRKYLIYKVLKNTSICTYPDIIQSFRMFWDKPLYYSEDPTEPAIMTFRTGILKPEDHPEKLLAAPIIRAAGVGIRVIATTENQKIIGRVSIAAVSGRGYSITTLPELIHQPEFNYQQRITTVSHNIAKTTLPEIKEEHK